LPQASGTCLATTTARYPQRPHSVSPSTVPSRRGAAATGVFTDLSCLGDIKGLGIGKSSDCAFFRAKQRQLKPIDRRGVKAHKEHFKATKGLHSKFITALRMMGMARSNPLFCRSSQWRASTRARYSGSSSAASESCMLDSMTFARSSRAIVRYPTWIATATSTKVLQKEALDIFHSRIRRVWDHASVFA